MVLLWCLEKISAFTAHVTAMQLSCNSTCNCHAGDSQQWEMCVNLNLTAPMLLTQAFAAGMEKKKVRNSSNGFHVCKLQWCFRDQVSESRLINQDQSKPITVLFRHSSNVCACVCLSVCLFVCLSVCQGGDAFSTAVDRSDHSSISSFQSCLAWGAPPICLLKASK